MIVAFFVGALAGLAVSVLVVLWLHEHREFARQDLRERAAAARHAEMVKRLEDNRALTLAAIRQRNRLESRTSSIEAAINDHADQLAALGRTAAARVVPGGDVLKEQ